VEPSAENAFNLNRVAAKPDTRRFHSESVGCRPAKAIFYGYFKTPCFRALLRASLLQAAC
jgi:hypothetical protein